MTFFLYALIFIISILFSAKIVLRVQSKRSLLKIVLFRSMLKLLVGLSLGIIVGAIANNLKVENVYFLMALFVGTTIVGAIVSFVLYKQWLLWHLSIETKTAQLFKSYAVEVGVTLLCVAIVSFALNFPE